MYTQLTKQMHVYKHLPILRTFFMLLSVGLLPSKSDWPGSGRCLTCYPSVGPTWPEGVKSFSDASCALHTGKTHFLAAGLWATATLTRLTPALKQPPSTRIRTWIKDSTMGHPGGIRWTLQVVIIWVKDLPSPPTTSPLEKRCPLKKKKSNVVIK